ncbi:MAG: tetratricopeptide repeat protein [Acidobacteria bacterium]|nr:tetratricopeptide repeat protein [Acidobacteriota bacterium]
MPPLALLLLLAQQDPLVAQAFDHFYNLEYDQAVAGFEKAIRERPGSPDRFNHLAQAILYREMFRSGALESELVTGSNPFLRRAKMNPAEEDQRRFDDSIRRAMELAQARVDRDGRDVSALYALGVAYGLRANYSFLVRKAWRDSLRDATTARKLHNRVTELDPKIIDARLIQGVHDYVVGSLPWGWKLLGFLVGFRGDKEQGIRTLQYVARNGDVNRVDAEVLLAAVYRRERNPKAALPLLEDLVRRYPRNYLLRFEMVQMFADAGDKAGGLRVLAEIEKLRAAGAPGYARLPVEKIYFSRGVLRFWYWDLDAAIEDLRRVTARAGDLDLNTGVYACLRLGQACDLKGRRAEARQAYRQATELAPDSEAAKEARRYLDSPFRRAR